MKIVFLGREGTVIVDPPDLRVDKIEKIVSPNAVYSAPNLTDAVKYIIAN